MHTILKTTWIYLSLEDFRLSGVYKERLKLSYLPLRCTSVIEIKFLRVETVFYVKCHSWPAKGVRNEKLKNKLAFFPKSITSLRPIAVYIKQNVIKVAFDVIKLSRLQSDYLVRTIYRFAFFSSLIQQRLKTSKPCKKVSDAIIYSKNNIPH